MKTKRLICPKCGNTEKFNVDIELQTVSAPLDFNGETAELDISFPNDLDLMSPTCGVCGSELILGTRWGYLENGSYREAKPNVMCSHCKVYQDGVLVEHCKYAKDYPNCFKWKNGDSIELELVT